MRRSGGFGQGPRPITREEKSWQAEILKPLILSFGFGILLNLGWLGYTALQLLDDPYSAWVYQYKDNMGAWWKIIVIQWMVALGYLFMKWTETFWDDDYTTLVGDHPMLGILPMRPIMRLFLFVAWLRGLKKERPKKPDVEAELHMRLRGENDG